MELRAFVGRLPMAHCRILWLPSQLRRSRPMNSGILLTMVEYMAELFPLPHWHVFTIESCFSAGFNRRSICPGLSSPQAIDYLYRVKKKRYSKRCLSTTEQRKTSTIWTIVRTADNPSGNQLVDFREGCNPPFEKTRLSRHVRESHNSRALLTLWMYNASMFYICRRLIKGLR